MAEIDRKVKINGIEAVVPECPFFQKIGEVWAWVNKGIPDDVLLMEKANAEVMIFASLAAAEWNMYKDPTVTHKDFKGMIEADKWQQIYEAASNAPSQQGK